MTSTSTFSGIAAKLFQTRKSDDSASSVPQAVPQAVIDDIKALRTMITMLSVIHVNSGVKAPEIHSRSPVPTETQSKELKILTALATVLVMDHEEVAVVAKHGNGERVEVFACTDRIAVDESTKSSHSNIMEYFRNLLVTANPRKLEDANRGTVTYPIICNPKSKYYPKGAKLDQLKADVKQYW
jgi:hypothetical protein